MNAKQRLERRMASRWCEVQRGRREFLEFDATCKFVHDELVGAFRHWGWRS
jgi:hypothetical protein